MFKNGRINVRDEERTAQSSVVSDDPVDQKICETRVITISELSCEFPQISRTVLYEVIIVMLCYDKFCARWVLKMLTGVYETHRMASALTFLE
jgi:hypothetical protein